MLKNLNYVLGFLGIGFICHNVYQDYKIFRVDEDLVKGLANTGLIILASSIGMSFSSIYLG